MFPLGGLKELVKKHGPTSVRHIHCLNRTFRNAVPLPCRLAKTIKKIFLHEDAYYTMITVEPNKYNRINYLNKITIQVRRIKTLLMLHWFTTGSR